MAAFVKDRKPSAQEIIMRIRRIRKVALWEFQQALIDDMERDFWRPPLRPLGVPSWVKKGKQS